MSSVLRVCEQSRHVQRRGCEEDAEEAEEELAKERCRKPL
eukprot:CAMPEP_0171130942 /NCGR_PEP_ID=MMETSP0766_2-20121228/121826_1 /TAXON_ID=439317 /ORGANISM="Gambierdiscus australes, Strain CAWD 149" /LENGTH=39 /DNA_ID= /DNA_START= /DNA_END= /DNA_ORIENTATION=